MRVKQRSQEVPAWEARPASGEGERMELGQLPTGRDRCVAYMTLRREDMYAPEQHI